MTEEAPKKPTLTESFIKATQEVPVKDWCWIGVELTALIYAFVILLPMFKKCKQLIPERNGIKTFEKKKTSKARVLKKVTPSLPDPNWHVPHKEQKCRYLLTNKQ